MRRRVWPHRGRLMGAVVALVASLAPAASAQAVPSLSINDVSVTEGNGGAVDAVFTVRLSAPPAQDVSVAFATADDSATAGADYQATQGTLSFPAGSGVVAQAVAVRVLGDAAPEPDETFRVVLSNPSNATIADGDGRGTIINDDPSPQLSISDASVIEGNSGTVDAVFTVTLPRSDAFAGQAVSVRFATSDTTATAGSDYQATQGTLSFPATPPGVAEQALEVRVPVLGETAREADEAFLVTLSNPTNADLADGVGAGTIKNDDSGIRWTQTSVSIPEGRGVFPLIQLTHPSALPITVTYATADGTARAGSDYVAISPTTLTFPPGQTFPDAEILVSTIHDQIGEPNETFFVNLSSPVNAAIDTPQDVFTILDDEPRITISDATSGGDARTAPQPAVFKVTVSRLAPGGFNSGEVRVGYGTANGTAVAGRDYVAKSGTLVFPVTSQNTQTQTISVSVIGDSVVEPDETFSVNLSGAVNALITDSKGVGTILDASDIGGVGAFELTPTDASVQVHERLGYALTWTVPAPESWHALDRLELRLRDDGGTILWVRFREATGTFALVDPESGREGKGGQAGDHKALQTNAATLYLADASAVGSGPTGPSVTLNLSLGFKPRAGGRTFAVEVAASDDLGHRDDFVQAGTLTVR